LNSARVACDAVEQDFAATEPFEIDGPLLRDKGDLLARDREPAERRSLLDGERAFAIEL